MPTLKGYYQFLDRMQFSEEWDFRNGISKILKGPIFPFLITVIFIAMAGVIVMRYLDIAMWRHDSFHYTPDQAWYEGNLKGEGRWINYFLFDIFKMIPGKVAALVSLISLSLYGYLCSSSLLKNRYLCIIIGLSFIFLPVVHAQNLWPNFTMVASVALPCFYFLSKKVHPYILFGLSAIFYFGTLSQFYFFIPLIYLGDLYKSLTGEFKHDIKYVLGKVIIPYCLFFIIGFLVANGIVILKTGEGIILGDWRKPTPVTDLDQLITNISKIHQRLFQFCGLIFSTSYRFVWIAIAPLLILSLNKRTIWILLVLIVMLLSPFYTTVYHGVNISYRTLMPTIFPFFMIFLLIPGIKFKSNILHLILCLALIFPFFKDSSDHLQLFGKIGSYYQTQIERAMSIIPPKEVKEIIVFVTKEEVAKINRDIKNHTGLNFKWSETLGAVNRTIVTPLRGLGYEQVFMMQDNKSITDVKAQVKDDSRKDPYIIFPVNSRPFSFGIILNNMELDVDLVDSLN